MDAHRVSERVDGPIVVAVRGPSRSGKTAMVERLVTSLRHDGLAVGYLKRTHHLLDLPHKASGRVWACRPSAMLIHADDRTQLTFESVPPHADDLIRLLPQGLDIVLLETHTPEPYPTLRSDLAEQLPDERVIGEWSLDTLDTAAAQAGEAIRAELPGRRELRAALGRAEALHGGHSCAGLVLGARLALAGAASLGIEIPDHHKRLRLVVETDRCSFDAIQAVTGCSLGRGTLAIQDHGKLAATFFDDHAMNGLRVAVRPGLRTDVTPPDVSDDQRHAVQRQAYIELPDNELFTMRPVPYLARASRDPLAHARRFDCRGCGEEVLATFAAAEGLCKPCAVAGSPLAESKASRG